MWWKLYRALHLIAMVTWFAGLFYLPRIFVYQAMSSHAKTDEYFRVMAYKLYYYITYPGGIATTVFGGIMLLVRPEFFQLRWMQIKLVLVFLLWCYHLSLGYFLKQFKSSKPKSHVFFRFWNEIPTILLIVIILIAVFRPGS
jgi:protoporphyrinogen IX oxidase